MSHYERTAVAADNLTVNDLLNVAPITTKVQDGVVFVGGVALSDIIDEFGTALYVYDEATLRKQLSDYLNEFRSRYEASDIIYAAKSFCCVAMDKIVAQEGVGIDVASGGELAIAKAAGFPMDKVFVQGNNKTQLEIEEAIEAGVACFVVDTHEELERINLVARGKDIKQKVILRICPGVEADTLDYIMTANEDSKFGFNIKNGAAKAATEYALKHTHLDMAGYHMHIGSQIFDLSCWPVAIKVMFEFMNQMRADLGYVASILDLGGGLGIPYLAGDKPSSIAQFAQVACDAVKECAELFDYPLPHLYTEQIGRASCRERV